MTSDDFDAFSAIMSGTGEIYKSRQSPFSIKAYWLALQQFALADVERAFIAHIARRDEGGKFFPRPADLLTFLEGSSNDNAQLAWTKVDKAVRCVGPWQDVVFDDPIIHRVIDDLGGWQKLCNASSDRDFTFQGIDFRTRYAAIHSRRATVEHPSVLTGMANQQNACNGQPLMPPRLVGDPAACRRVMQTGSTNPALAITTATAGDHATRLLN